LTGQRTLVRRRLTLNAVPCRRSRLVACGLDHLLDDLDHHLRYNAAPSHDDLLALPYLYMVPKSKGAIELWDTTSWKKVAVLEGHAGMIDALAFSTDGKFLVSGSEDTSARVWAISEQKE
jgi:WD40 repeat protein